MLSPTFCSDSLAFTPAMESILLSGQFAALRGMVNIWPVSVLLHKRTALLIWDKSEEELSQKQGIHLGSVKGFSPSSPV